MVAYSFKARFVGPIVAGEKQQTIRGERRRHARPGEQIQLYTGMRTRRCRLIGRARCAWVSEIVLDFHHGRVDHFDTGERLVAPADRDVFARADGFADWGDMRSFWDAVHGPGNFFRRFLVRWDSFEAAP